jgi:hypothetical protein
MTRQFDDLPPPLHRCFAGGSCPLTEILFMRADTSTWLPLLSVDGGYI